MKNKKSRKKELDSFRRELSSVPETAFDGHTEFSKLSVEDKLL